MTELLHFCEGLICETDELLIHPQDLGFMRGYGVFDFAPVYKGVPFKLKEHLERLAYCAKEVGIEMPDSIEGIEATSYELLKKMPWLNGGLRFFITGGACTTDTLISSKPSGLMILSEKAPEPHLEGVKVVTTQVMRPLPHIKTIGYLPAVLGAKKAHLQGCDDALYQNAQGELLEGMTSNLFFIKEGALYTDDSDQIIKGVTRSIVLNIAKEFIPIHMRPIHQSELKLCEEAFLTSSTKDLVPVTEIDQLKIGSGTPGKFTQLLRKHFVELRHQELSIQKVTAP